MIRRLRDRVLRDPVVAELMRSSGPLYAAGIITIVLTIGQQLLTARFLGAESFGRLAAALGYVLIIGLIVDVRTWELGTRLLSAPIHDGDGAGAARAFSWVARVELITGAVGAAVVCVLAPLVGTFLLGDGDTRIMLVLAPIVLSRQFALGVSAASLRILDRFVWLSVRSVATAVARLVLVAGPAVAGADVVTVAIGVVTADVIGAISMTWLAARAFRSRFGRSMLTWDLPEGLSDRWRLLRSLWASATIKTLHVESFVPVAAAFTQPGEIGVLRSGLDVGNVTGQMTAPLTMVISPKMVLLTQRGDRVALEQYIRRVRGVLVALVAPAVLAGVVLVVTVLPSVLGEGYESIRPVASILLVALGISATTQWVRPLLVGLDAVRSQNRLGVVAGLLSLTFLPLFVSRWGAVGGAVDMLVFLTMYATLSAHLARRSLDAAL